MEADDDTEGALAGWDDATVLSGGVGVPDRLPGPNRPQRGEQRRPAPFTEPGQDVALVDVDESVVPNLALHLVGSAVVLLRDEVEQHFGQALTGTDGELVGHVLVDGQEFGADGHGVALARSRRGEHYGEVRERGW